MRTMLLSFKPEVYNRILSGEKIFEHRRTFPNEPIKAYMYVSSPVCEITGILFLGKRHNLNEWKERFSYDGAAVNRIEAYLQKVNYAMEILEFRETTSISLNKLREDMGDFVCPQMYYYLEGKPLLKYLEENLIYKERIVRHSFDTIDSETICRH